MCAGLKDTRDRINSIKNTQKITDAMKLVAAAKVRRAQDAVVNGRPFSENLVKVSMPITRREIYGVCSLSQGDSLRLSASAYRSKYKASCCMCCGSCEIKTAQAFGHGSACPQQARNSCETRAGIVWSEPEA